MGLKIIKTITILLFFLILPASVLSKERIAGQSASVDMYGQCKIYQNNTYLLKNFVLTEFFKQHSSPLAYKSNSFISSCQKYKIDCYLLPSIAAVESYYGKRYIKSYNNPFGWGGGYYKFKSLEEAIETVSKNLKTRYINRGANNLKLIGKYYSTDTSWYIKTNSIKKRLEKMEKKYDLLLSQILVE